MSCASLLWAGPSPSRPEYTRINIRVSPKQWGNDREITVGVRGAVIARAALVLERSRHAQQRDLYRRWQRCPS